MPEKPTDLTRSPCCSLPLLSVAAGMHHVDHFRCAECQTIWVWSGSEWVLCQSPEAHCAITRKEIPHAGRVTQ